MKLSVVLCVLLMSSNVNAQRAAGVFIPQPHQSDNISSVRDVIDTLVPTSFVPVNEGGLGCFTGYFNSPDSGYVSGNNQYGDLEKAQFFSLTQMGHGKVGTINGMLVHFAYKTLGSEAENIVVKIYDVDTNGFQPKNLLGTSDPLALSSITTDGASTYFSFAQPVAITDSFFASVQLPSLAGDTLVILSTDDGCVSTKGWSWELWSNGTWHQTIYSWVLDFDLAIFPVVDLVNEVGVDEISGAANGMSLYPNPADDFLNLSFNNSPSRNISLQIMDQLGRIIYSETNLSGLNSSNIQIPVSKFENGLYMVRMRSGESTGIYQVIVQH